MAEKEKRNDPEGDAAMALCALVGAALGAVFGWWGIAICVVVLVYYLYRFSLALFHGRIK